MRMYFRSRTCFVFILFSLFGSVHSTFANITDEQFQALVRQVEALQAQYITVEDQRNVTNGELVGIREQNRIREQNHTAATNHLDRRLQRHNVRLNEHDQGLAGLAERIRALDENKASKNETTAALNQLRADLDNFRQEVFEAIQNQGKVGEIKYSLLTERQFQRRYGTSWVLLDGRSVVGSDYAQVLGQSSLPDARGQFLRCHNGNRDDGQGNPSRRECKLGSSQMDEIRSHGHGGSVGKGQAKFYRTCSPVPWRASQGFDFGAKGQSSLPNHQLGYEPNCAFIDRTDDQWSNSDHTHSLTIENTGGLETRPRCTIVNAFIKIHQGRNFNPPAQAGAAASE